MQGKTHMIGGALAAGLGVVCLSLESNAVLIPAMLLGAFGGIVPDIDHKNSKISHKTKPVSALITLFFSHRGFFHTPILYCALWLIWRFFTDKTSYMILGDFFFMGTFSHLILDLLNPLGISAFFPFWMKRIHLGHIRTGSIREMIVRMILTTGCICLCLYGL